jgi:hypothetical protein
MITKAVIALIWFGLTSSANAMTVIFKDYKAANNDERAFYLLYLDGVREGIIEPNVALEEKRQQPLFCLPEVGADGWTGRRYYDASSRKITDPEQLPIGLLLAQGLQNTFPCDEIVTRLDRDGASGVNHAWNSRHRCRDTSPAVPMAYP